MLYANSRIAYSPAVASGRSAGLSPLAKNLRALRERAGLNQTDLAGRIGVGQGQISKWETGADAPRAENIAALALALRVSADEILRGLAGVVDGKIRMLRPKRPPAERPTAKGRRVGSA